MNLLCLFEFGFGFDGTLKHTFRYGYVAKRDTMTQLNAAWKLEYYVLVASNTGESN